jgi:putative redox protein
MSKVICKYVGDFRCEATLASNGARIRTDAPAENKGKGEYFAPTDLVAAALGNCMLTMMGYAAERASVPLSNVVVEVEKELSSPPGRIIRLKVTIRMPRGLSPDQRAKLEKNARMCPVHHSLPADMDRPVEFIYPD